MTVHAPMVWRGFASTPDPQHSQHLAVIAIRKLFGLALAFSMGSRRCKTMPFARSVAARSLAFSSDGRWAGRVVAPLSGEVSVVEDFFVRDRIPTDSR